MQTFWCPSYWTAVTTISFVTWTCMYIYTSNSENSIQKSSGRNMPWGIRIRKLQDNVEHVRHLLAEWDREWEGLTNKELTSMMKSAAPQLSLSVMLPTESPSRLYESWALVCALSHDYQVERAPDWQRFSFYSRSLVLKDALCSLLWKLRGDQLKPLSSRVTVHHCREVSSRSLRELLTWHPQSRGERSPAGMPACLCSVVFPYS